MSSTLSPIDGTPAITDVAPGMRAVDASGMQATIKSNHTAISDPGIGDNFAAGYAIGSDWINTASGATWRCTGDGIWSRTNGMTNPGGSANDLQINDGAGGFAGGGPTWDGSTLTVDGDYSLSGTWKNGYGGSGLKVYTGLSGTFTPNGGAAFGFGNYYGLAGMYFATDNGGVGMIYNGTLTGVAKFNGSAWSATRFVASESNGGYDFAPLYTLDSTSGAEGGFWREGTRQAWGSGRAERISLLATGLVGINDPNPQAQLHTVAGSATTVGQIIELASSQTANAFEINSSTGSDGDLFAVNAAGDIQPGSNRQVSFKTNSGVTVGQIGSNSQLTWNTPNGLNASNSRFLVSSSNGHTRLTKNTSLGWTPASQAGTIDVTFNRHDVGVLCLHGGSGQASTNAAPTAATLIGQGGAGTNISGGGITIAGGQGSGDAVGGKAALAYADPGPRGTALNALTDVLWCDSAGIAIGEAASRKLGFFGSTPVMQQAHIADPSGGATVDAEARTAIDAILAALETFGLLATS